MPLSSGRDVTANVASLELAEVALRAVASVGRDLLRLSSSVALHVREHRVEHVDVVLLIGQVVSNDDLVVRVHRELPVVALHVAVGGLQDLAVGVGEVALRFVSGRSSSSACSNQPRTTPSSSFSACFIRA